jgi:hypothetical protein
LCTLWTPVLLQSINDVDFWNIERPKDMANLASLEVMCGKTHMEVQVSFDRPFNGIIFSKGAVDQYNCIYVKPQTGSVAYSFNILYDQVRILFRSYCIHWDGAYLEYTVRKRVTVFAYQAGMPHTKLSMAGIVKNYSRAGRVWG